MGLSFWDTVRGVELADTLIRKLPTIAEGIENNALLLAEIKAIRQDIADIKALMEKDA